MHTRRFYLGVAVISLLLVLSVVAWRKPANLSDSYRVLVVSDLHLTRKGEALMSRVAAEYGVSLIINVGDTGIWGKADEAKEAKAMLASSQSLLYVPGNHDSPRIVRAVKSLPNAKVLDGEVVTVDGLRVYGLADPASYDFDYHLNEQRSAVAGKAAFEELSSALASGEATPDIIAVHDPVAGKFFRGVPQVLLSGHTHTKKIEKIGNSWYVNVGTTGGIAVSNWRGMPSSCAILYFSSQSPRKLLAIDFVEVSCDDGMRSTERVITEDLTALAP